MLVKRVSVAAAGLFAALMSFSGGAHAQAWSEANTPGFFGGYNHFGGYYDTYGPYGGHYTYNGYVRTESHHLGGAVTIVTVPLQRRSYKKVSSGVRSDCSWLKHRAEQTGKRKWKTRYQACLREG